jgi:hypothetical protein
MLGYHYVFGPLKHEFYENILVHQNYNKKLLPHLEIDILIRIKRCYMMFFFIIIMLIFSIIHVRKN